MCSARILLVPLNWKICELRLRVAAFQFVCAKLWLAKNDLTIQKGFHKLVLQF